MTRLFTDGAEMGDLYAWSVIGNYWTIGTTNPVPYQGQFYYRNNNGGQGLWKILTTSLSEGYLRARVFCGGWANTAFWVLKETTQLAGITFDSNHHICAKVGGSVVLDSGWAMRTGQVWQLLEIYYKIADSGGRIVAYVDGILRIDYTGDTKPGADTVFDRFGVYCGDGDCGYDDIAFNDTMGDADNSWCGDGSVIRLDPNNNGAHNNWTGSDGDQTNNYLHVDDFAQDGDTSYVYAPVTSPGVQDQYAMTNYSATGRVLKRVWAEARVKKMVAEPTYIKLGLFPSGGADAVSGNLAISTTGLYQRITGNEYVLNPADGQPWEEADINALEGIVQVGDNGIDKKPCYTNGV